MTRALAFALCTLQALALLGAYFSRHANAQPGNLSTVDNLRHVGYFWFDLLFIWFYCMAPRLVH